MVNRTIDNASSSNGRTIGSEPINCGSNPYEATLDFDILKKMKQQVLVIRGGETFDTREQFYDYLKNVEYDPYEKKRNRRDWLEWSLCENFDSFAPLMPNKQSADYFAWKIRFERLFPYIKEDKTIKLILI